MPKGAVLQAYFSPWPAYEPFGQFFPAHFLKEYVGYEPTFYTNLQTDTREREAPVPYSAHLNQVPPPGYKWTATSIVIRFSIMYEAASYFQGAITTLESFTNKVTELENALAKNAEQITVLEGQVAFAKNRFIEAEEEKRPVYEINGAKAEYQNAVAQVAQAKAESAKIKTQIKEVQQEKNNYLIEGAEKENEAHKGSLSTNLMLRLPGGRTQYIELKDPSSKKVRSKETGVFTKVQTIGGEELGFCIQTYVAEYTTSTQLVTPIVISDTGQPELQFQFGTDKATNNEAKFRPGNFTFNMAMGTAETFLNYENERTD